MAEQIQLLQQMLKENGQSFTKPRQIVFAALQNKEPQTVAELLQHCGGQIDRASLYRTLALFEQLTITHRLYIGWKYRIELSDIFHEHHHHITCEVCGRTDPLPDDSALEDRLQRYAQEQGYQMRGHQMEIRGICAACVKESHAVS